MLRPLLLVVVVTMIGCTTSLPPGSSPPAVTPAGQLSQQAPMQIQQQARVGDGGACVLPDFGDPCSACVLKCAPPGEPCRDAGPSAVTVACVRANCREACAEYQ
jgi:hypothetical protein